MQPFFILLVCFILNSCGFFSQEGREIYNPPPAYRAVERGDLATAKSLVAEGSETSHPKYGNLLHAACGTNNPELIDYVMSLGLNIEEKDEYGFTPLHIASATMMKSLIKHGAVVNAYDFDLKTPLYTHSRTWAGEITKLPIQEIELLIKNGADINEIYQHQTVLDFWITPLETMQHNAKFRQLPIMQQWEQKQKIMIPYLRKHGAKTYEELKQLEK